MVVETTAYGAGTRKYDGFPNVLRLIVGESVVDEQRTTISDRLTLIETNIDDLSPQIIGFVMERAFELGALDCWFTPIQMKKNRPATMISILCDAGKKDVLARLLYTETTTIGVRLRTVDRECLDREIVSVDTEFGPIDVKLAMLNGKVVNAMPEYDQVRSAAVKHGSPFRQVRDAALRGSEKRVERKAVGE